MSFIGARFGLWTMALALAALTLLRAYAAPIFVACAAVALWQLWRVAEGEAAGSLGLPTRARAGKASPTSAAEPKVRRLDEVLTELDGLVGLGAVKAEIARLVDVLAADTERRRHGLMTHGGNETTLSARAPLPPAGARYQPPVIDGPDSVPGTPLVPGRGLDGVTINRDPDEPADRFGASRP